MSLSSSGLLLAQNSPVPMKTNISAPSESYENTFVLIGLALLKRILVASVVLVGSPVCEATTR